MVIAAEIHAMKCFQKSVRQMWEHFGSTSLTLMQLSQLVHGNCHSILAARAKGECFKMSMFSFFLKKNGLATSGFLLWSLLDCKWIRNCSPKDFFFSYFKSSVSEKKKSSVSGGIIHNMIICLMDPRICIHPVRGSL